MSHVIENDFLEIVRFLFYCMYRARKGNEYHGRKA